MAATNPATHFETLEHLVIDTLVQTGKAFKSSLRGSHRVPSASDAGRIQGIHLSFNSVLDEVESELTRAKAALQRDLDQLRAKRRPVVIPEPVMIPLGAVAPPSAASEISAEPPSAASTQTAPGILSRNLPKPPALHPGARSVSKAKQGAPFPNMGIDPLAAGLGTQLTAPKQAESTPAATLVQTAAPAVRTGHKGGSPVVKAASSSPALNPVPSAVRTGSPTAKALVTSPALPTGSTGLDASSLPPAYTSHPVVAPVRPAAKPAAPTGSGLSLTPASDAKAHASAQTAPSTAVPPRPAVSVAAPPSVAVPVPGHPPALSSSPNVPRPTQPTSQRDALVGLLDMGDDPPVGGGPGALMPSSTHNPHLNFTDMQFSLAPANVETQAPARNHGPGQTTADATDIEFDLDTFVADATNNILSDSFSGGGGNQPLAAAAGGSKAVDLTRDDDISILPKAPDTEAADTGVEALFRLDGDGELGSLGDVPGGTNFDNMWVEADSGMEEFDGAYFGL